MTSIPSTRTLETPREDEHWVLNSILAVLRPLGSLRLTVALLVLSMVLVLAGTLAQETLNLLQVKERYFTCWIAKLHFEDFIPQVFYKHTPLTAWIPFPGGSLVGTLLLVNLLAAKITRFHARARGAKLAAGLAALAVGFGLMLFVILSGNNTEGVQGEPPISYANMWRATCASVGLGWLAILGVAVRTSRSRTRAWSIAGLVAVGTLFALMVSGIATLGDPGLRILWQLVKGTGVAMVLMLGCHLIFARQGGNVLLHFGVALLMVGQFAYGDRQLEQRLLLAENESTNTLINLDSIELAFLDRGDPEETKVSAIPASRLIAAAESGTVIRDEALPLDVRVVEYMVNSKLVDAAKMKINPATAGMGNELGAEEARMQGGASGGQNVASVYYELLEKDSGDSLGVYLATQYVNDGKSLFATTRSDEYDRVSVGERKFDVALRFERIMKPYWVKLIDVERADYAGDTTARSFASVVRLVDTRNQEDRKERIWMNNPLRYRGETFYQSQHTPLPGGKEQTGLQVVKNSGWLIPYLACSITAVGMLFHFMGTLRRYVSRRDREPKRRIFYPAAMGSALVVVVLFVLMKLVPWSAVAFAMNPDRLQKEPNLYAAGAIPVQYGGRLMPLDTYARLMLKSLSSKESVPLTEASSEVINRYEMTEVSPSRLAEYREPGMREKRLPALQWLLEVAAVGPENQVLFDLPMIRIDAREVLNEVGIDRRRKSKLYSLQELLPGLGRVQTLAEAAREKDDADLSFKERKLIELATRMQMFLVLSDAIQKPQLREVPDAMLPPDADQTMRLQMALRELDQRMERVAESRSPGIVPQAGQKDLAPIDRERWLPVSTAMYRHAMEQVRSGEGEDVTAGFMAMVNAYQEMDPFEFNKAIDQHRELIEPRMASDEGGWQIGVERWLEAAWPQGVALVQYNIALLLALGYLLVNKEWLRASAWTMLAGIFVIHSVAIIARIVVTERPPVINLYSSAIFIGWAAVLFGIVVELQGRRGIGNLISATSGAATLWIATRGLSGDDTMPVLQAVLDTQFWLGTHVTTVTLGYSATFVSGLLGIAYLLLRGGRVETRQEIYRMMYGVTCFGILFSFVGTVLGGLWADDSWGRFWGWDPKENGALLIVIWNALMLHARWDKLVGPHGFSMLAIGGNIVTAWSWFGTNELGFGLHSYGFTEGTMWWLGGFIVSQLALIAAAWVIGPAKQQVKDDVRWE